MRRFDSHPASRFLLTFVRLSRICTCLGYSKEYSDSIVDLPDKYHSLLKEGEICL